MFWRNKYEFSDFNDNIEKKKKTNYTYSDSFSYRNSSKEMNCPEPNLSRYSLNHDLNEEDYNEMSMRKSVNNQSNVNGNGTPTRRRSVLTDSDRVLRSQGHSGDNQSATVPFVRENNDEHRYNRFQDSYRIGALNTNTNNSGPDELEDNQFQKTRYYNYDLSGDEDIGSDTLDADNLTDVFGSNNANVKKSSGSQKERTRKQWFQKNMFGLPNEESDETHQDLSGAISGDEQFDIAPYQKTSTHHKSKSTKTQRGRKLSSNNESSKINNFENISCSPIAMMSFLCESILRIIVILTRRVVLYSRRIFYNSTINQILLMPYSLSATLIRYVSYVFAYSIDRLFGTTYSRRYLFSNRARNTDHKSLPLKLFTLFILLIILVLFYLLFHRLTTTTATKSTLFHYNLFEYGFKFVGDDCMKKDNCCPDNWSTARRFIFCFFSLPARMLLSQDRYSSFDTQETNTFNSNVQMQDVPKFLANDSDSEFFSKLGIRLDNQDKELQRLKSIIVNFEREIKNNKETQNSDDKKFSELTKNIDNINENLSSLKAELTQFKLAGDHIKLNASRLSDNQQENINLISSDVEKLKEKIKEGFHSMNEGIQKIKQDLEKDSQFTNEHKVLLKKVQESMNDIKTGLNKIDERTVLLEDSNKQFIKDSDNIIEKIKIINEEFNQFKLEQEVLKIKFNEKLSVLEHSINENQSLLFDKEYFNKLILPHYDQIKDEVNMTMWSDLKNYIDQMLKSTDFKYDMSKAQILNANQKSCNCLPSNCRCSTSLATCVRMNQVRQMLNDAINLFAADKIGKADFALESAGGTIATTRCTETYTDRASTLTVFGIPLMRLTNSPRTIIQPSMNPGECWPMKGSKGSVVVKLSAFVKVSSVSIDHIPKSLSPSESIDSAIKEFEIKAYNNETDLTGVSLGNFTYLIDSNPVQTFHIQNPTETQFLELIVKSNYGNKEYTCIYRFRVHGKLIET